MFEDTPDIKEEDLETESVSDSGSDELETQPQEPLPESPVYDQHLRRDLDAVRRELDELATLIHDWNAAHGQYSTLARLLKETEQFRDFQIQAHRIVGFIGDSGVGKSSTVNSLLDQKSIARSGGDGAACTSVVTEFRYIDDTHKDPFTIEVRFMSSREIRELLEELLRDFRVCHCAGDDEDNGTPDDRRSSKDAATRAWVTLQSMLPGPEELTEDLLASAHETSSVIVDKLEGWAIESLAHIPGAKFGQTLVWVTNDLKNCKEHLDVLMSRSKDREKATLWPFINLVRVYLDAPILQTGLVLADLPGFRDSNYARVRATERYLLHQCDEVFIVSNITRCCTDQSIVDIKRRCGDKPNHIICTRSEDVSAEEEACGESDYSRQVEAMNRQIQKSENMIERANRNRHRVSKTTRDGAEKLNDLRDKLDEQQLKRNEFLVNTRNSRVKEQLQNTYAESKVFCLSNKLFSKYRWGRSRQGAEYTNLSGILELRQHCFLVPAQTRFRAISAYLTHQVPAHLGSLRQWTLVGADFLAVTGEQELRSAFDEVDALLYQELLSPDGHIERLMDDLIKKFKTTIVDFVQENEPVWRAKCLQTSEEWATWYHTTHAAFCRHYGNYRSGAIGHHCWNDELADGLKEDLQPQWETMQEWLEHQETPFSRDTSDTFKRAYDVLRRHERTAPHAIRNILSIMSSREKNIRHDVTSCIEDIKQATQNTSSDMCRGHDSSFIGTAMRPVYLACSDLSGKGAFKKRKDIIRETLESPDMLFTYRQTADKEYITAVRKHFATLTEAVRLQIEGISNDLVPVIDRATLNMNTRTSQEFPELIGQLKAKVDDAQKVLEAAQRALKNVC